jgi:hypothetical protein
MYSNPKGLLTLQIASDASISNAAILTSREEFFQSITAGQSNHGVRRTFGVMIRATAHRE